LLVDSVHKVSVVHYILQGWTALHHAACDDNEELCKLLISYGADKTAEATVRGEDVSCVLFRSMLCIEHATALCAYIDMVV